MLPLWIIDLREKSVRRDFFESLVRQIEHVFIRTNENSSCEEKLDAPNTAQQGKDTEAYGSNVGAECSLDPVSEKDYFEREYRQDSDQNSIIEGDYWWYSCMADNFYGISISNKAEERQEKSDSEHTKAKIDNNPTAKSTADRLYKFQSDLVAEGQRFIKKLRESNAHPDIKVNIVVLGDITEDFTRIVFPAIAGLLQKEKGRILPHHIHQGMEIIGMLYIPCDINAREVSLRRSMQRTLKEIDVQHCVNDIRGYDHMMFYQDVQNRTECSYHILNDKQLAEYLLQCLVHLYLACNDSHPLLSGTSSADVFYFSMGATSVFYDSENEDIKARQKLAIEFIRNFKSNGDDEKENQSLNIINPDDYSPETFIDSEAISKLNPIDEDEERPSPNPIRDFMAKHLKQYYYNLYLRFFTQNMMQRIINNIDNCTRASLESIAIKSKRKFSDLKDRFLENLTEVIGKLSANDGGLPAIERILKSLQGSLSQKKSDIQNQLEQIFWRKITEDFIPKDLKDRFEEYHEAFKTDLKNKTGNKNQTEVKKQAVTELNGILSQESTMLSRICRSLLLGIMCVLAIVPVLNLISPTIIDLGRVRRYSELWSVGVFFIPVIFQIVSFWRYNRNKKRYVNNLKAMYLHDAYARVGNRIETEINLFYDKVISLADLYINRCETIRNKVGKDFLVEEQRKPLFPESMFNQPLIGGQYGKTTLLPDRESDDAEIRINYIRYKLSKLDKVEYFLFINQNKTIIKNLFKDISLCENLMRRVKDNGEEELVTKDQHEKEQQHAWEQHCNEFHKELTKAVKSAVLQRMYSTVGEKLCNYCISSPEKSSVLKPMVAYAATNGEITSSADIEFTDAKINDKRVNNYLLPFMSSTHNMMQSDKYNSIYKKYIFITRWRCFEHFNLNRILPMEDFDEKIRRQCIYAEEMKDKERKEQNSNQSKGVAHENTEQDSNQPQEEANVQKEDIQYTPKTSSLLLWALCPDDSSSEWFRLFDSEFFAEAYADKNIFREILNQND